MFNVMSWFLKIVSEKAIFCCAEFYLSLLKFQEGVKLLICTYRLGKY